MLCSLTRLINRLINGPVGSHHPHRRCSGGFTQTCTPCGHAAVTGRVGGPRHKARFRSQSSSCSSPRWFASLPGWVQSYSEFNLTPGFSLPRSSELRAARPAEGGESPAADARQPRPGKLRNHSLAQGQEPGDGFVQGQHIPAAPDPKIPARWGHPTSTQRGCGSRSAQTPAEILGTRTHPEALPQHHSHKARPGPRRKTSRVNCDRPKHFCRRGFPKTEPTTGSPLLRGNLSPSRGAGTSRTRYLQLPVATRANKRGKGE